MTTLATMRTRIETELNRTDLTDSVTAEIVSAIRHYERERFYFNETTSTFVTVSGTQSYANTATSLSDAVLIHNIVLTVNSTDYKLNRLDWDTYRRINTTASLTGQPYNWAYFGETVYFYPIPNGSFTANVAQVTRLTEVSMSATGSATNAWMTDGEELIRQRARAAVKINVLEQQDAKQEAMMTRDGCLSAMERMAYLRLKGETAQRLGTGRLKATNF